MVCGSRQKRSAGIFFQDFVDGYADVVFIGARFGFDGEGDGRLRQLRGRMVRSEQCLSPSVSPVMVSFEFGDGADIAGVEFLNFGELFPLNDLDVLETLGDIAIEILERGVVFEDAAT